MTLTIQTQVTDPRPATPTHGPAIPAKRRRPLTVTRPRYRTTHTPAPVHGMPTLGLVTGVVGAVVTLWAVLGCAFFA